MAFAHAPQAHAGSGASVAIRASPECCPFGSYVAIKGLVPGMGNTIRLVFVGGRQVPGFSAWTTQRGAGVVPNGSVAGYGAVPIIPD